MAAWVLSAQYELPNMNGMFVFHLEKFYRCKWVHCSLLLPSRSSHLSNNEKYESQRKNREREEIECTKVQFQAQTYSKEAGETWIWYNLAHGL
jgi:hypothetical protein